MIIKHWFIVDNARSPLLSPLLEKEMATHSKDSHGQRSLACYSPWCHKSQTQLSD